MSSDNPKSLVLWEVLGEALKIPFLFSCAVFHIMLPQYSCRFFQGNFYKWFRVVTL